MSPQIEGFVRGIGTVVLFAVLGYVANATNLTGVVGPNMAALIAAVAASVIAAYDHAKSPAGTVAFGTIGKRI